jgi:hypothetical protein
VAGDDQRARAAVRADAQRHQEARRILERADLVVTEKVGRARRCRLGAADLGEATEWIEAYRAAWEARLDRFAAFVEEAE